MGPVGQLTRSAALGVEMFRAKRRAGLGRGVGWGVGWGLSHLEGRAQRRAQWAHPGAPLLRRGGGLRPGRTGGGIGEPAAPPGSAAFPPRSGKAEPAVTQLGSRRARGSVWVCLAPEVSLSL